MADMNEESSAPAAAGMNGVRVHVTARWNTTLFPKPTETVASLKEKLHLEDNTPMERIAVSSGGILLQDSQNLSDFADLQVDINRLAPPLRLRVAYNMETRGSITGKVYRVGGSAEWFYVDGEDKLGTLRLLMQQRETPGPRFPISFLFSFGGQVLDEDKTFLENQIIDGATVDLYVLPS